MPIQQEITERLQTLNPTHLELIDDSHLHIGHAGSKNGGKHFRLTIASDAFSGVSRLKRQRMIQDLLQDLLISGSIHALSIRAYTPEEFQSSPYHNGEHS